MTYSSGRQQDLTHRNLLIFKYRATSLYLHIFASVRRIFITRTLSNRELSICHRVKKILSLMTKICTVFFGVFVCFAGIEAENQRALIYRASWMLWTTETFGAMWSIQKNPMLKDSEFGNPEYTYALCESGFHNLECIKEVIFRFNEHF